MKTTLISAAAGALWVGAVVAASLSGGPRASAQEAPGEAPTEASPAAPPGPVVLVRLDAIIHQVAEDFLAEALADADLQGAEAVVVEINTPGGLMEPTRGIIKGILSARTPVIVYVAPSGAQAASAGFFILMAADVAAMAPGTNTGAAHPVGAEGKDIEGHMGEKVEQDSAALIRTLAQRHGRSVEAAEAAVLESVSYTADEALEAGVIDRVESSLRALLVAVDGRRFEKAGGEPVTLRTAEAEVVERRMPAFQRFLSAIAHPQVAAILMALGFLGLYMELSNPGTIFPGVFGAICLILAFYAFSVLPISYAGIALILLALVLFIAELQVVSYGVLTMGGVIALVIGWIMLVRSISPVVRVGIELIVGVVVGTLLIVGLLMAKALQVLRGRVATGSEGLVGERGVARTVLDPRGKVFVHGEIWSAESAGPVEVGHNVEVIAVEGLNLRVRPFGAGAAEAQKE